MKDINCINCINSIRTLVWLIMELMGLKIMFILSLSIDVLCSNYVHHLDNFRLF